MRIILTPHGVDYLTLKRFKKISEIFFYSVFIISLIQVIEVEIVNFDFFLEGLNIVLLILYSTLNFIIEYYLFPQAGKVRRTDFIDNSFGTNLNIEKSVNYYSNDEVQSGIYKLAVNLFENCFFTLAISKKMRFSIVFKNSIFCIILIFFAEYGFKNSPLAIPILQLLLSANLLGELIKIFIFINKNESILNNLISLFSNKDFKLNPVSFEHLVIKYYVDYESNSSWSNILLNSSTYERLNPSLSQSWAAIKNRYHI